MKIHDKKWLQKWKVFTEEKCEAFFLSLKYIKSYKIFNIIRKKKVVQVFEWILSQVRAKKSKKKN